MIVVFTTFDKREGAIEFAKSLLEKRYAACVSIFDSESFYWWNGKIEKASEYVLMIKTLEDKLKDVVEFIEKNHSYEVPEILVLNGEVFGGYKEWLKKELKTE